jgi:hypothetical protein
VLQEYKRKTNIGVGVGIVLQIAGRLLDDTYFNGGDLVGLLVIVVGICIFIWGCAQYARGKGHSPYWGAFGLLSVIGLIVLVVLPDKHKATIDA